MPTNGEAKKENPQTPESPGVTKQQDSKNDPATNILIKPLRTYEDDVKDALSNQQISSAKIMLAEQKKQEKQKKETEKISIKSPINKRKLVVSFLLIIIGGAIGYGTWLWQTTAPEIEIRTLIRPPIIDTDSQVEIITEGRNRSEIESDLKRTLEAPFRKDAIREIFLTKNIEIVMEGETVSKKAALTSQEFLNFIETNPPTRFSRSLDKEFILGIYSLEKNQPFILFKISDFENAFISMLEWESTLIRDIMPIFYSTLLIEETTSISEIATSTNETATSTEVSEDTKIATSTEEIATSSPIVLIPPYDPRDFKDVVLNNRDTRLIKDKDGKILFFYTFIDEDNLIMATSNETLGEVIKRIRTASLIR